MNGQRNYLTSAVKVLLLLGLVAVSLGAMGAYIFRPCPCPHFERMPEEQKAPPPSLDWEKPPEPHQP